jgi:hypothetical protein
MAHPQSSPFGLWAKQRINVTTLGVGASLVTITGDSSGILLSGGIKVSNKQLLTGDSTGIIHGNAPSALPGSVDGGNQWTLISNSTGVALAVNTSGTTWKYLNVTTLQPT